MRYFYLQNSDGIRQFISRAKNIMHFKFLCFLFLSKHMFSFCSLQYNIVSQGLHTNFPYIHQKSQYLVLFVAKYKENKNYIVFH